jgi:hypothetical protein
VQKNLEKTKGKQARMTEMFRCRFLDSSVRILINCFDDMPN